MEPLATPPWKLDQELQLEARALIAENISPFLAKLSSVYPSSFFPVKTVQELIHNPALPLEALITSAVSPAMYKSVLNHLEAVLAPIDSTSTTKDIHQIATVLVTDPLFPSIDDSLFKIVCRVVAAKSPLTDLSDVRLRILSVCTPTRFSLLGRQFLEASYQDQWPETVAQSVLENILHTHTYPFLDKYRFLLRALNYAGQKTLHQFLLQPFSSFIPSAFQREEVLLMLSESAPYDFPVFFFKNEHRLLNGLDKKYSANVKRIKKQCYARLTFVQKILSAFPILM